MVYLLHFERGYKHARHYIGATSNPDEARALARGELPRVSVPLLDAVRQAGIAITVDRTWPGDYVEARRLRDLGGAARLCGCCARERRGEAGA